MFDTDEPGSILAAALPPAALPPADSAGRLSYVKVRALTRIATPETEAGLAEVAGPMTGNQLERFARAHRQVSQADDAAARVRRRLTWRFEEDGSLSGTFRLPPLAGAVLLTALRAAAGDLEPAPGGTPAGVSAETPPPPQAPLDGTTENAHDAGITPETIIPPWYGERLDLDHAIYVCFANARTERGAQAARDQAADEGPVRVYEPDECAEMLRQYLETTPRRFAPVQIPIEV